MKNKSLNTILTQLVFLSFLCYLHSCTGGTKTRIGIEKDQWLLNGKVINEGSQAEGLLMNVRMVNAVFEDRGDKMPKEFHEFDKIQNTENFISKIPEYMSHGVNAFTISLQGGNPGYEGAVNTAFEPDGTLREEYLKRIELIINEVDKNGGIVILTCFYQRQHSHDFALNGKKAFMNALKNTAEWIRSKKFNNVLLEVSNEYNHRGFAHWKDGDWLKSATGQAALISYVKTVYPELLVSTSGLGNGKMDDAICEVADFILIHFNGTSTEDIPSRISKLKKWGKPIVCNEDDKTGKKGAEAMRISVANGCAWGYMNNDHNQYMPFLFEGADDDTLVYRAFKTVAAH